jgi:hypothetical protein
MRVRWKLVGLAGLAGVAATGVVLARKRRAQHQYEPDELRERLHRRLAEVAPEQAMSEERSSNSVAPAWGESFGGNPPAEWNA